MVLAPAAPTAQQAESWLPFIRDVGLPWIAFFVLLGVLVVGVYAAGVKLMPELRNIALALRDSSKANEGLAREVHSGNTPPMGTPAVPGLLMEAAHFLKEAQEELRELRDLRVAMAKEMAKPRRSGGKGGTGGGNPFEGSGKSERLERPTRSDDDDRSGKAPDDGDRLTSTETEGQPA